MLSSISFDNLEKALNYVKLSFDWSKSFVLIAKMGCVLSNENALFHRVESILKPRFIQSQIKSVKIWDKRLMQWHFTMAKRDEITSVDGDWRLNALIKLMRIFLASTAHWITTPEFRSTFRLHQSLMLAEQRASTSDAMNFQDNPGISPVPFQTRSEPQFKEYQVDIKFSLNIKHCLWSNKKFQDK